jgi:2'-5' RNA ligase
MAHSRYALYLTPPTGSDLWKFGCDVIGRDASTGLDLEGFAPEGHTPESWRGLTDEPRRYGFHATLLAPFRIRADLDVLDLIDGVAAFARKSHPFEAGGLQVGKIATADGRAFVALKPTGPARELRAFEEMAVRKLDALRAPLTQSERRRREAARLTPLQRYYLDAWGYPYVLDEFRPHFTLTNALIDFKPVEKALRWDFQMRVGSPHWGVEALTLFGERESDGIFEILREFPLGRSWPARRLATQVAAAAFID